MTLKLYSTQSLFRRLMNESIRNKGWVSRSRGEGMVSFINQRVIKEMRGESQIKKSIESQSRQESTWKETQEGKFLLFLSFRQFTIEEWLESCNSCCPLFIWKEEQKSQPPSPSSLNDSSFSINETALTSKEKIVLLCWLFLFSYTLLTLFSIYLIRALNFVVVFSEEGQVSELKSERLEVVPYIVLKSEKN